MNKEHGRVEIPTMFFYFSIIMRLRCLYVDACKSIQMRKCIRGVILDPEKIYYCDRDEHN